LDALDLGFEAAVIRDACRAIGLEPRDEERALLRMSEKGARILFSRDV
jgi:nicotinamidase/pyrazinamidase